MPDVDIGLAADIRFPGGTSTALVNEIRAIRALDLTCALSLEDANILSRFKPFHPELLDVIDAEKIPVLASEDQCSCRLAIVHHPAVCMAPGRRRNRLVAPRVALVAHHPAVMRDGRVDFDYGIACAVLREQFGVPPLILPVGPAVRRSFDIHRGTLNIHDEDWVNLIDLERFTPSVPRTDAEPFCVGRHSRPDVDKWPDPLVAELVYPERDDIEFRMLGVNEAIRERFTNWPSNWQALPFQHGVAQHFLQSLDAYSYFHAPNWAEAFGYNILEALACGLPTILPPHFRQTFGDGPIYAKPTEVGNVYDRLIKDRDFRVACAKSARKEAGQFSLARMEKRLHRLLEGTPPSRGRVPPSKRPDTTLVVTSNGIGAGHIARQLAVAREASLDQKTVFFTLSEAASFARQAGYLAEARPFHRKLGLDPEEWNIWFRGQLGEALKFYRPQSVIFDGNMPYSGFLDALRLHHDGTTIWMRRGMWRKPDEAAAKRSYSFDLILEPGELAQLVDPGFAAIKSAEFVQLPVILSVPSEQRLSRDTARRLLDLPDAELTVFMALGSGQNRDIEAARQQVFETFADAQVVELINPLAPLPEKSPSPNHLQRKIFPAARFLGAFDCAVLSAGYNSYHESLAVGLPALFLPNTHPEMDLQEVRADYAAQRGWALSSRADDPYSLSKGLSGLADAATRARLASAASAIECDWSGATHAARLIALTTRRNRRATKWT